MGSSKISLTKTINMTMSTQHKRPEEKLSDNGINISMRISTKENAQSWEQFHDLESVAVKPAVRSNGKK